MAISDPTLFFVCGHPRSGTNWVRGLLNAHPHVICLGESPFARIREVIDQAAVREWSLVNLPDYRAAIETAFTDMVRSCTRVIGAYKPFARCVGDHTPRLLFPYVPGTRHIHMVRDGRDVLVSWTWHHLRYAASSHPHIERLRRVFRQDPTSFSRNPHELLADEDWCRKTARDWGLYVKWDTDTMERMRRGELIGSVLSTRFEDLHASTREVQLRMLEYLAMDPAVTPALTESDKTAAGFSREDPTAFYRSGKVGEWKRYFTPTIARWFEEEAGESLILAGYEQDRTWAESFQEAAATA